MPKSRKKKSAIPVLVPEKPTANLTSTMRAELYATPESFENVQGASNNIPPEQSGTATKTKISQHAIEEEKKEIGRSKVVITKINDMQLYDADVVRTYSLSSGTISYDSIKSMANESLEKIKINSKHVQNAEKKLHKVIVEQLLGDESIIAKMRLMSDSELNRRMTGRSHGDQKTVAPWGLWETILTKKCINEVVENFFASPRDDIELTMKLSRRNVYPRLHIELAPIYHELHIQAARLQQNAIIPFTIGSRHRRFDDLLRTEDLNNYSPSRDHSMQSMESRSASMCYAHSSDATTARSPNYDYISSAYSYLVAFVKNNLTTFLSVSGTESKSNINEEM